MPLFERINPFLGYAAGLGLGAEMARSIYTDGGNLVFTAFFSVLAAALIVAGEVTHRLEQKKTET